MMMGLKKIITMYTSYEKQKLLQINSPTFKLIIYTTFFNKTVLGIFNYLFQLSNDNTSNINCLAFGFVRWRL